MGSHHYTNGHETAGHLRAARYSGTMSTAHTKPLSELIDPGWAHALAGVEPQIHAMGDFIRDKDPKIVGVLATVAGEKVTFVAVCGKEAVAAGIKAGDLVRAVSAVADGKGGGKPDSAMGGGTNPLKTDDALAIVDDFVAEKLGI